MDWPKLPDGTVDWMTVFQDPKTGLISLLELSDTSDKLRDCFRYVIDALFTREDDAAVRQTYYDILEETFDVEPGEDVLGGQKVKIRMVMMRVMNDRIKLAREYAEAKAAESAGEGADRRAEDAPSAEAVAV